MKKNCVSKQLIIFEDWGVVPCIMKASRNHGKLEVGPQRSAPTHSPLWAEGTGTLRDKWLVRRHKSRGLSLSPALFLPSNPASWNLCLSVVSHPTDTLSIPWVSHECPSFAYLRLSSQTVNIEKDIPWPHCFNDLGFWKHHTLDWF